MIWFKHPTDSSTHDQLVSRVEDRFGLEGYARLYKLIEAIVSQMKVKGDLPSAEYPESKWCQILKCKSKRLQPFLGYLQHIHAIEFSDSSDEVKVTFLKLSDLLDNRSVSSRLRGPSGSPRAEQIPENKIEEEQQKQTADDAGDLLSWITEPLKGQNVKQSLPRLVYRKLIRGKIKESDLPQIEKLVRRQFKSSEKAQRHGEVIIWEIQKAVSVAKSYLTLADSIKSEVSPDFLENSLQNLHRELEADRKFIAIRDRCKSHSMSVDDILYVKSKGAYKNLPSLEWIKKYEDVLVQKGNH